MKGKFTFHHLIHNNKIMILFSVILSIAIWASVVYGQSIPDTKTITVAVNMDMSNTLAGAKGMKNFTNTTLAASVMIRGSRWVVSSATSADISVTPDFNNVGSPNSWSITLTAQKTSDKSFDIVSLPNPSSVTVFCDYKLSKTLPITIDKNGVDVKDTTNMSLGTPVISTSGIQNNSITIEGPQTYISQIASIVARVDKPDTIAENQTFSASLVALDSNGSEVDTKYCTFDGLNDNKVNIVVPVNIHRAVKFTTNSLIIQNMPEAYKNSSNFITVSPASIELMGPNDQVENYAKSIEKSGAVGTIDFNHLGLSDMTKKFPLNIPQGITEKNGITDLTVSFAMQNFTSVPFDVPLTNANTHFLNIPSGKTVTAASQLLSGVTIIGPSDTISKIKESDIAVSIDLANDSTSRYATATVQVPGYNDVWVYYSDPNMNGYQVYVTVQ